MYHTVPVAHANFSGHESFPLRFAWLKKGYDSLKDDEYFFSRDDAMVRLGVGKNMVRAIRHWGLACQIWSESPTSSGQELNPTRIGHIIFNDDGVDPYLEEIGTVWFLHWLLVTNDSRATTWSWLFGRPRGNRFTRDEIMAELKDLAASEVQRRVAESTLKRDVAVILRSYCRPKANKSGFYGDDALDGPFVLLNLVRPGVERNHYEIVQGHHPTLTLKTFEAALVDYLARRDLKTVTLDDLLYTPFSPGRTFRLSEEALVERLSSLIEKRGDTYAFDETAGLRQLLVHGHMASREEVFAAGSMLNSTLPEDSL